MLPQNRPQYNTARCFEDLVTKFPQLDMLKLIAEFCKVTLATVQSWQRGETPMGGETVLRLRCFLQHAGYDPSELVDMSPDSVMIARIVGNDLAEPYQAELDLGYPGKPGRNDKRSAGRLLRIAVHGEGYLATDKKARADREAKVAAFIAKHKAELEGDDQKEGRAAFWEQRIAELTARTAPIEKIAASAPPDLPPGIALAFQHSVGVAVTLGKALESADMVRAAIDATGNGMTLLELRALIDRLMPPT